MAGGELSICCVQQKLKGSQKEQSRSQQNCVSTALAQEFCVRLGTDLQFSKEELNLGCRTSCSRTKSQEQGEGAAGARDTNN